MFHVANVDEHKFPFLEDLRAPDTFLGVLKIYRSNCIYAFFSHKSILVTISC